MPNALYAPRINNNDDSVQVVRIHASVGDPVKQGEVVAEVETDKAVTELEASRNGFVLKIQCSEGEHVAVGSVLMWLGETADEPVPENSAPETTETRKGSKEPTAKARAMLAAHGLDAASVPYSGDRLTVSDIEAFLATGERAARGQQTKLRSTPEMLPLAPGRLHELSVEEKAMLNTVSWQRDNAAAAYVEMEYDEAPWQEYADEYAKRHKLLLSPFLPLLAYKLVETVKTASQLNATIVDGRKYLYDHVNLGFTVQAGETLYLTVLQEADILDDVGFIAALGELQRHAMKKKLRAQETQGATVAFSSMARWKVSRHVPVLPPFTSLIVAHATPRKGRDGTSVLGASYDHRVMSGYDACRLLESISTPPSER